MIDFAFFANDLPWSEVARNLGYATGGLMAGLGACAFFLRASRAVERVPTVLDKQWEAQSALVKATERQAAAAEQAATLIPMIEKIQHSREEIENSLAVISSDYDELKLVVKRGADHGK